METVLLQVTALNVPHGYRLGRGNLPKFLYQVLDCLKAERLRDPIVGDHFENVLIYKCRISIPTVDTQRSGPSKKDTTGLRNIFFIRVSVVPDSSSARARVQFGDTDYHPSVTASVLREVLAIDEVRKVCQWAEFPSLRNRAEGRVDEALGEEVGDFGGCVGGLTAGHFGADGVEVHEPALEQALGQFLQCAGGLAVEFNFVV